MLPQHATDIRELIMIVSTYDFSKEHCTCLRMIVGSKHVGVILSVLMWKNYLSALVDVIIKGKVFIKVL